MKAFLRANGIMLAAALALVTAWFSNGAFKKAEGRREAVQQINTKAKEQVHEAKKARAAAARPGAAERLRQRSDCRDC